MPTRELREGDVISFRAPVDDQPVVTHRVIDITRPGAHPVIRTRGDANPGPDPWTARVTEDVVWRQRAVIPHVGSVIEFMRRPGVHEGVLYGALALFLGLGMRSIWGSAGDSER
jgi:signal peptidase